MRHVYKVCCAVTRLFGESTWAWNQWHRHYELGAWTTPEPGTGLFVFRTKHDALRFAVKELGGSWLIYRCEHAGRMRLPPSMSAVCWARAWQDAAHYRTSRRNWSPGAEAVRALRPVAIVATSFDHKESL